MQDFMPFECCGGCQSDCGRNASLKACCLIGVVRQAPDHYTYKVVSLMGQLELPGETEKGSSAF